MTTSITGTISVEAKVSNETVGKLLASISESYDKYTAQRTEVPVDATDQAISLGGITTANVVVMKCSAEVSVKFNSSLTALVGTFFMIAGAAITSIAVSNSGENKVDIDVFAAGDDNA